MENAVKLSLVVGKDVPDKLSERAEDHTVHINGAPTLAATIKELMRLRQLAQAAGRGIPYNAYGPPVQRQ